MPTELERLLKTESYRKIIRFFHENPASVDTPRGVSTWTGLDIKKVRTALRKLAKMGILAAHKVSSTTGYSYTSNKKKVAAVGKLLMKER